MPEKTALELWDALVAKRGDGQDTLYRMGIAYDGYRDLLAALERHLDGMGTEAELRQALNVERKALKEAHDAL